MVWHTLKETMELTGRSRRSLYRDMAAGLVSYSLDINGRRQFETSELMRVYGAFVSSTSLGTSHLAHSVTSEPSHVWDQILAEIQTLRQEVQELKSTVLRLEHKPDKTDGKLPKPPEPVTWAGLLDRLDD